VGHGGPPCSSGASRSVGDTMERSEERPDRRTNHRLRMLIDDLQSQLRDTRHALEYVRDSVADLRVDVEELRRAVMKDVR
jgi:chromosome segregation ATPase